MFRTTQIQKLKCQLKHFANFLRHKLSIYKCNLQFYENRFLFHNKHVHCLIIQFSNIVESINGNCSPISIHYCRTPRKAQFLIFPISISLLQISQFFYNCHCTFALRNFKELATETQIPDKELKRSLLSLAMGKPTQRILCRKGYGREIGQLKNFLIAIRIISSF